MSDRRKRWRRLLAGLVTPRVFISIVLSLALIGALLAFSDFRQLEGIIGRVQAGYLLAAVVFILAYNAVQMLQWLYLLDQLQLDAPEGDAVFAFIGGNLSKYLPGGSYFQNYLLYESSHVDPAISSVATTLIALMEPAVALLFLGIIGVDHWVWLRWVIAIGLPLALLFAWGVYTFIELPNLPSWLTDRGLIKRLSDEVARFRQGLARIAHRGILVMVVVLTAFYVLLEGLTLYLVCRALRIDVSVATALAAYYFSIGVALIVPIFTNLGTLEAGGVGALIAMGVSRPAAVAAMVLDRGLIIAVALVVALFGSVVFRKTLRTALGLGR